MEPRRWAWLAKPAFSGWCVAAPALEQRGRGSLAPLGGGCVAAPSRLRQGQPGGDGDAIGGHWVEGDQEARENTY